MWRGKASPKNHCKGYGGSEETRMWSSVDWMLMTFKSIFHMGWRWYEKCEIQSLKTETVWKHLKLTSLFLVMVTFLTRAENTLWLLPSLMDGHPRRPLSAEPYFNSRQRQPVSPFWPESEDFVRASREVIRWSGWKKCRGRRTTERRGRLRREAEDFASLWVLQIFPWACKFNWGVVHNTWFFSFPSLITTSSWHYVRVRASQLHMISTFQN